MGLFDFMKKEEFVSLMTGILHPMEEVPDPAFSEKLMGDGFAVELTDGACLWHQDKGRAGDPDPHRHRYRQPGGRGLRGPGKRRRYGKTGRCTGEGGRGICQEPGKIRIFPGHLYRRPEDCPSEKRRRPDRR